MLILALYPNLFNVSLSHKKIANAIQERDEEMAEQLMKEHIEINQNYLE